MKSIETLVVGAGPVGLFFAAELRRAGHDCMVIDRADGPSSHSKALAIMPGTLEMFETCGLAQAFVNEVNRIDAVRFVTPRSSAFVPLRSIRSRFNFVSILPQWKTEQLLAAQLQTFGGNVLYGHELTGLELLPEGAAASIRTDQGTSRIEARYVIGCDGVYSTVREQAAIAFNGVEYPGASLLADLLVDTEIPMNEARVHIHARGVVTMFPMDEHLRRVVVIAPREQLPGHADRDWLNRRLNDAGYAGVSVREVVWSNAFRVQRRVASAMRRANVFLAGDSVHTHSPVGGQGMNMGLHDAYNLAAKLGGVLDGARSVESLDAYERERLPVARAVVRTTDILTRALAHPNPVLRATRERIAPRIAGLPMVYEPLLRRLSLTA